MRVFRNMLSSFASRLFMGLALLSSLLGVFVDLAGLPEAIQKIDWLQSAVSAPAYMLFVLALALFLVAYLLGTMHAKKEKLSAIPSQRIGIQMEGGSLRLTDSDIEGQDVSVQTKDAKASIDRTTIR